MKAKDRKIYTKLYQKQLRKQKDFNHQYQNKLRTSLLGFNRYMMVHYWVILKTG